MTSLIGSVARIFTDVHFDMDYFRRCRHRQISSFTDIDYMTGAHECRHAFLFPRHDEAVGADHYLLA